MSPFQIDFVKLSQLYTIARTGFADLTPGFVIDGNSLSLTPCAFAELGLAGNQDFAKALGQFATLHVFHKLVDIQAECSFGREKRRDQAMLP